MQSTEYSTGQHGTGKCYHPLHSLSRERSLCSAVDIEGSVHDALRLNASKNWPGKLVERFSTHCCEVKSKKTLEHCPIACQGRRSYNDDSKYAEAVRPTVGT